MLTSDLAINWRRGDKITPRLIKTNDAIYLRDAEILSSIFEEFQNKTRGALERELEEYIGTGTDYRILRGFIKLLMDRSEFETSSVAEPVEIREKVFLAARKFQPVLPYSNQKNEVLETDELFWNPNTKKIYSNKAVDIKTPEQTIHGIGMDSNQDFTQYTIRKISNSQVTVKNLPQ